MDDTMKRHSNGWVVLLRAAVLLLAQLTTLCAMLSFGARNDG
jgi:hypothetical protein